jgi:AraC family transcriptional regulator of adaptative response / DNA-3-methyladenine glycosylase II
MSENGELVAPPGRTKPFVLPPLDDDACYRATAARDGRFDGLFFVGVTTTGIYCRPVCRARLPKRCRCVFFRRAAEAERAGFRACFRCRPEQAPGRSSVDAVSRLVARAAAHIEAGALNEAGVEDLARQLGVTARHVRRAVSRELGVTPVELAQSSRLAVAKQLLQGSAVPLVQVAFAAGFQSVRRYNALFRARFGRSPAEVRRSGLPGDVAGMFPLTLGYRAPFAWEALLAFLAARAARDTPA